MTGPTAGWDALVGAALLGTDRRPADLTTLPAVVTAALEEVRTATGAADAATTLLDAAALLTVHDRAGRAPRAGRPPVTPAPVDSGHPVPVAAAARLGSVLTRLDPAARGGADRADGLLRAWLQLTADAGRTVPPAQLPALLDLAARHGRLAAAVAPVLGPRGWWLAALRADWDDAVAPHRPSGAPAPGGPQDEPGASTSAWEHGTGAERRAWLRALRRRDPAAARTALLALTWRSEKAEDRAAFVAALGDGLSPEDEELLERARTDRSQDVRRSAERLLALLPGAAWTQQVRRCALAAVQVGHRRLRRTLVVTLPDPADPAVPAVSAGPAPAGTGPGAWAFQHLVALTPPPAWEEALGEGPERLLALPVDGGLGPELHRAWARAALLHRDRRWARALLEAGTGSAELPRAELLGLLTPQERVAAAVELVTAATRGGGRRRDGVDADDHVGEAVRDCPAPWPPPLADAVLDWLAGAHRRSRWTAHEVLDRAAFALPAAPAVAARLRAAADALPDEDPWRPALTDVADTVAERHQMLEEFR